MNYLNPEITADRASRLLPEFSWLDQHSNEMLQLVIELCDCNSGTLNIPGVTQVAELLTEKFEKLGGKLVTHSVAPLTNVDDQGQPVEVELGPLIHITKRPELHPRVLLCIHMDTVYPKSSPFQKCRFVSEGVLNGPGVADAKGGLVVMLYTLLAIEKSSLSDKIGWEVIINPDEELGSPGSAKFLQERAEQADVGLLFEPKLPDGTLVSTRKGVGNFIFVVKGRSAHAGREFPKGRNAIVACCKLMTALDDLNRSTSSIVNVGKIAGGEALNVVPDVAVGRCNVRVSSQAEAVQLDHQIRQITDEFSQQDGINVQMLGGLTSMPKESSEGMVKLQKRIERCGQALNLDIQWKPTGGASDGNKFASAGLVNIDTLGPLGGDIHSTKEYLQIDSLVPSAKLAALTMATLTDN